MTQKGKLKELRLDAWTETYLGEAGITTVAQLDDLTLLDLYCIPEIGLYRAGVIMRHYIAYKTHQWERLATVEGGGR